MLAGLSGAHLSILPSLCFHCLVSPTHIRCFSRLNSSKQVKWTQTTEYFRKQTTVCVIVRTRGGCWSKCVGPPVHLLPSTHRSSLCGSVSSSVKWFCSTFLHSFKLCLFDAVVGNMDGWKHSLYNQCCQLDDEWRTPCIAAAQLHKEDGWVLYLMDI